MGKSMLDYTKQVLEKMSFDKFLVQKEWGKSLQWLMEPEMKELERWVHATLGKSLRPIYPPVYSGIPFRN